MHSVQCPQMVVGPVPWQSWHSGQSGPVSEVMDGQTDKQMDGQMTSCGISALCIASHGKKRWHYKVQYFVNNLCNVICV